MDKIMQTLDSWELWENSITSVPFPWQQEALSAQRNHCAPSGSLSKDLSLLYVMFTLTIHGAPKSKHMALYTVVYTTV